MLQTELDTVLKDNIDKIKFKIDSGYYHDDANFESGGCNPDMFGIT